MSKSSKVVLISNESLDDSEDAHVSSFRPSDFDFADIASSQVIYIDCSALKNKRRSFDSDIEFALAAGIHVVWLYRNVTDLRNIRHFCKIEAKNLGRSISVAEEAARRNLPESNLAGMSDYIRQAGPISAVFLPEGEAIPMIRLGDRHLLLGAELASESPGRTFVLPRPESSLLASALPLLKTLYDSPQNVSSPTPEREKGHYSGALLSILSVFTLALFLWIARHFQSEETRELRSRELADFQPLFSPQGRITDSTSAFLQLAANKDHALILKRDFEKADWNVNEADMILSTLNRSRLNIVKSDFTRYLLKKAVSDTGAPDTKMVDALRAHIESDFSLVTSDYLDRGRFGAAVSAASTFLENIELCGYSHWTEYLEETRRLNLARRINEIPVTYELYEFPAFAREVTNAVTESPEHALTPPSSPTISEPLRDFIEYVNTSLQSTVVAEIENDKSWIEYAEKFRSTKKADEAVFNAINSAIQNGHLDEARKLIDQFRSEFEGSYLSDDCLRYRMLLDADEKNFSDVALSFRNLLIDHRDSDSLNFVLSGTNDWFAGNHSQFSKVFPDFLDRLLKPDELVKEQNLRTTFREEVEVVWLERVIAAVCYPEDEEIADSITAEQFVARLICRWRDDYTGNSTESLLAVLENTDRETSTTDGENPSAEPTDPEAPLDSRVDREYLEYLYGALGGILKEFSSSLEDFPGEVFRMKFSSNGTDPGIRKLSFEPGSTADSTLVANIVELAEERVEPLGKRSPTGEFRFVFEFLKPPASAEEPTQR